MRLLPLAATLVFLSACELPRDPEGTLERIEGGVMRVGVTENAPWTVFEGEEPGGVEVELVRELARDLGAEAELLEGSESDVLMLLEEGALDLVIGGFTEDDPWSSRVSFTQPYVSVGEDRHVMAVPHGENAWIVRVERFLRSRLDQIRALLREHAPT
jgi:ABC-type amino acid transport substrate-binding protein